MTARRRAPAAVASLAPLQALVDNPLPSEVTGGLIALLGDHPSAYSRSPRIWHAALRYLGLDATYQPLDVPAGRLAAAVEVLRATPACWGANVTVPYKESIIPLLDELDPTAGAVGAINTIIRRPDGRLVGANTDGVGVVAALLDREHGPPLCEGLYGADVLLIGAGGAARAAAVALAGLLGTGELLVTNRTADRAAAVVTRAVACGARARIVDDDRLDEHLPSVQLVINASTRGQAGLRRGPAGWTSLEPYSALAPAAPAVVPPGPEDDVTAAWEARSSADVAANHARSRARMRLLSRDAVVVDMIYAPPETVTMRHAREIGLRAANGRWMMIVQAAEACVAHICADRIAARGADREALRRAVIGVMADAWDAGDRAQPRQGV